MCRATKRAEMEDDAREMLSEGRREVAGSGNGDASGAAGTGHWGSSENASTCKAIRDISRKRDPAAQNKHPTAAL